MPGRSALARLFLLAVLAFGVACMHTLGHQGFTGHVGSQTAPHGMPAAHGMPADAALVTALAASALAMLDESPMPRPEVDPLAVCLAILSLALLLVVSLLLAAKRRQLGQAFGLPARVPLAGRGPPIGTPVGLALASASVMRI